MSKGSAFTRTVAYFRNADLVEAAACLQAATEVVASRTDVAEVPTKPKRKRRTKAQIAEARAAATDTIAKGASA